MEAAQTYADARVHPSDFTFSLEKQSGSWGVQKLLVVRTGANKTNLHERHLPPIKNRRIELKVRAAGDASSCRGFVSADVVVDCRKLISTHLAGSGSIKPKHDGRNLHLLDTVLTCYTEAFGTTLVEVIVAALQTDQTSSIAATPCRCILFCQQGRHRSVACAYWFAILLTILGAEVTVEAPFARLCSCRTCDAGTYTLLARHWDTWCVLIQKSTIKYLKTQDIYGSMVRDGLRDTIEFLDYCFIGLIPSLIPDSI